MAANSLLQLPKLVAFASWSLFTYYYYYSLEWTTTIHGLSLDGLKLPPPHSNNLFIFPTAVTTLLWPTGGSFPEQWSCTRTPFVVCPGIEMPGCLNKSSTRRLFHSTDQDIPILPSGWWQLQNTRFLTYSLPFVVFLYCPHMNVWITRIDPWL